MKQLKTISAAVLVGSLAFSGSSMAGDASAEALSYTCVGCHGLEVSAGPASPSLGGMAAVYIADSMRAFKEGEREATIMTRIAKGYDDEDFDKMGEFFSKLPRTSAPQSGGSMASKGEKLHDKYCDKCHTDMGTNVEDESGFLGGQWTAYLQYSMEDAHDGTRDYGKKMMKQVNRLKDKEGDKGFQALLDFYAGVK